MNSIQKESPSSKNSHIIKILRKTKKFFLDKKITLFQKYRRIYHIWGTESEKFKKILVAVIVIAFLWGLYLQNSDLNNNPTITDQESTITGQQDKIIENLFTYEDPNDYSALQNGRVINFNTSYLNGAGVLEIKNGTNNDAVVKLISVPINRSVYTVYIQANNLYKITGISDGRYQLFFMHGKDWDINNETFLINESFSRFADDFRFTTKVTERFDGVYKEYDVYEVTLNPTIRGDAETINVSLSEFNKY